MLDLDFENGLAPEVRAVLTSKLLTDFEFFNRFFFKRIYGRKFVMGEHHHLIAEKMRAVARGDIRRLIINIPPRYSKCIDPDTSVLTSEGMKRAGDVKFGDVLFSFDNGRLVQRRCLGTEPAFKKSVRVELRSGRTIICSTDHRLLSTFGYVEAGKLQAGDRLVALRATYEGNHRIPESELDYPYKIITHEHLSGKTLKMGLRCDCSKQISSKKFKRLVETFPQLKKYILDDFYYDTVVGIHDVGDRELIHLSVEGTHNFIANGIVSHNSEMVVRSFIAWTMANNPKARFMHLSCSDDLVNDNSDAIRLILKDDAFRYLFPKTEISRRTDAKDKWYTTANGGLYAVSTGGQITGFGAGDFGNRQYQGTGSDADGFGGAIIIDDPLKAQDATSDTKRERINSIFTSTIESRVNNPGVTPIVLIMQRLHDHDMAGFLLGGGNGEPWESLVLPAIKEDGTPLWPEKHSIDQLLRMKAADPETFAAQYMQSPMVADGNIFKREWFRFYDKKSLPVIFDRVFQSWDFTFKKTVNTDNICGLLWGQKGANYYLLERVWGKKTFRESLRAMMMMSENHPEALAKYVEAKANGEAVMDMLNEHVSGIIGVNPTESKIARAHAVTPLFEAGNIYVPDPSIAPWIMEYIDELTKFPNATHDDQVDATTQGLSQTWHRKSLWDLI